MNLETMVADKGRLFCDAIEIGDVEFSLTVSRDGAGRSTGEGYLTGDMGAIESCRGCRTAELASRHFGRSLIQIHLITDYQAFFTIAQPFQPLDIDGPEPPPLAALAGSGEATRVE
jgi:hypothetical protein